MGDLCGAGTLRDPDQSAAVRLFLFQLAINHTVVIENLLDKDTHAVTGTQLSASSPDEEAFVLAAAFFGMTFSKRSKDVVTLEIRGKPFTYRIVAMLPYTPMRKMMSLIVEDLQATAANDSARRFVLLCKGADSKILSLLDDGSENSAGGFSARRGIVESTKRHMEEWAKDGLRTLCFGCKPLPERDLERWLDEYNEVLSDISERQKKDAKQPNRIDAHMDALETGLTLQGATANEDKLQEQVPETIARLAEAGIKVFMLTGDKQETAVNVGFAASMLTNEFERILLTSEEIADLSIIPQLLESKADEVREMVRLGRESSSPLSIVLDEPVIDLVMRNAENRRNFLVIVEACKTVICCRCRPDQKKQVVQLVRLGVKGSCTLAIGDGANDVDMILEANVGVGIIGAEGVQAANSSDYSIGRFRFLQRLLLVHGRWNYMRMSMVRGLPWVCFCDRSGPLEPFLCFSAPQMVLYSFYKNLLYSFVQWLYNIHSSWRCGARHCGRSGGGSITLPPAPPRRSGQKFYIEYANQTFNLIYTGLPIIMLSVMDQDVSSANAVRFPHLYADGLHSLRLNNALVAWWVLNSLYESCLVYFVTLMSTATASLQGVTPFVFELGTYIFTVEVIIISVRLALNTYQHHAPFVWSLAACAIIWVPAAFLFDYINADYTNGMEYILYASASFWLVMLFLSVAAAVPVIAIHAVRHWMLPQYRDLVWDFQTLLAMNGEGPTAYQRFLTFCMTHAAKRQRPSARELLRRLEELAPAIFPKHMQEIFRGGAPSPKSVKAKAAEGGTPAGGTPAGELDSPLPKIFPGAEGSPAARGSDARIAPVPSPSVLPERLKAQMHEMTVLPRRAGWKQRLHLDASAACNARGGAAGGTVPHAEDVAHDLIEWPHEQQILMTLEAMRRGGATDDDVLVHQLLMVRARLVARVEAGSSAAAAASASGGREGGAAAASAASSPAKPAAAPAALVGVIVEGGRDPPAVTLAATPTPAGVAAPPRRLSDGPTAVCTALSPEGDGGVPTFPACKPHGSMYRLPPAPPLSPVLSPEALMALTAQRQASVREFGLPPPLLSTPSGGGLQWRRLRSLARMTKAMQTAENRTGSDFSCDAGHQSFYVGNMSTVGRRHSLSGPSDGPAIAGRAAVLAAALEGRALDRAAATARECELDSAPPLASDLPDRPASASAVAHGSSSRRTVRAIFGGLTPGVPLGVAAALTPATPVGTGDRASTQLIAGAMLVRASPVTGGPLGNSRVLTAASLDDSAGAYGSDREARRILQAVPRHPLVASRAEGGSFSNTAVGGVALQRVGAGGLAASPPMTVRPKVMLGGADAGGRGSPAAADLGMPPVHRSPAPGRGGGGGGGADSARFAIARPVTPLRAVVSAAGASSALAAVTGSAGGTPMRTPDDRVRLAPLMLAPPAAAAAAAALGELEASGVEDAASSGGGRSVKPEGTMDAEASVDLEASLRGVLFSSLDSTGKASSSGLPIGALPVVAGRASPT